MLPMVNSFSIVCFFSYNPIFPRLGVIVVGSLKCALAFFKSSQDVYNPSLVMFYATCLLKIADSI